MAGGGQWCFILLPRIMLNSDRSQSRMRGDYLFYEEKIETTQEEKDAKAARRYC
jgi:hypothetical protein